MLGDEIRHLGSHLALEIDLHPSSGVGLAEWNQSGKLPGVSGQSPITLVEEVRGDLLLSGGARLLLHQERLDLRDDLRTQHRGLGVGCVWTSIGTAAAGAEQRAEREG